MADGRDGAILAEHAFGGDDGSRGRSPSHFEVRKFHNLAAVLTHRCLQRGMRLFVDVYGLELAGEGFGKYEVCDVTTGYKNRLGRSEELGEALFQLLV